MKEKKRVLNNKLNEATDKPRYLLEKLEALTTEQLETYRQRTAATNSVRIRQKHVTEAEPTWRLREQICRLWMLT